MDRKTKETTKLCEFLEGVRKRCPDHDPVLEALGDIYTKMGRVNDGLEIDELLTSKQPDNATYWYNLGCSYSLSERPDDAISALTKAVHLGYSDSDWMLQDTDLEAIRSLPEFEALINLIVSKSQQ